MRRKVNKVGQSTLTVSLPSKWVKNYNLKVGDEVEVEEDGSLLQISAQAVSKGVKKTTLHLKDENGDVLRSIFGGLYRAGYDEIEIFSESYDTLLGLQNALDTLPALEYFEINNKRAVVKNVVSGMTMDIHDGISKMRHVINVTHNILIESIKSSKFDKYEEIRKLRQTTLKYRDIVSRIVLKGQRIDESVFPYYTISFVLATIPGYYRTIYNWLLKNKSEVSPDTINFLNSVNEYFNDLLSEQKSPTLIHTKLRELEGVAFSIIKKKKEIFVISFALAIARQIQSMNSSFMMLRMK